MNMKKVILSNAGKEAHFPGDNTAVAVCWNVHRVEKKIEGADGLTYKAEVWERSPSPHGNKEPQAYIDFVTVREDGEDTWEDEDSPVDGGLSIEFAEKIAKELVRAIQYTKEMKA